MTAPGRHAFPKANRLLTRRQFLAVQDRGTRIAAECLLLLWRKGATDAARLGLTVSSKVGNAVVRNRIRRHLREFYRRHKDEFPRGVDVVVIARNSAARAEGPALARAFAQGLAELRKAVA